MPHMQSDFSLSQTASSSRTSILYPAVSGLAAIGAIETAYLTQVKLFGAALVCPTSGCETILESSYSSLFGIPLSLFGMLTYGAVSALAASAAIRQEQEGSVTRATDTVLLSGSILLSTCSAALMYILQARLGGQMCAWCYLSAGLSFSLLLTVAGGMGAQRLRKEGMMPGAGALATGLLTLYLGFGNVGSSNAEVSEVPYYKPEVTTESSSQAKSLAQRLREAGSNMYGAFWCSHCFEQKQAFGQEAMASFPYVECFPEGWKRGVKMVPACEEAGVRAFPTWVINGRTVEGELSLGALEAELASPKGQPSPNIVAEETQ